MLAAVILGNRLNDDGSPSQIMKYRMQLALEVCKRLSPQVVILSGGIANAKAGISEAEVMYGFLSGCGVPQSLLVAESKSLSTKQNAAFSLPLAQKLGADVLVVCTSPEHMYRSYLNPKKLFAKQAKGSGISLYFCSSLSDVDSLCRQLAER